VVKVNIALLLFKQVDQTQTLWSHFTTILVRGFPRLLCSYYALHSRNCKHVSWSSKIKFTKWILLKRLRLCGCRYMSF